MEKLPGEDFKRPWPPLIKMSEEVRRKTDALFGNNRGSRREEALAKPSPPNDSRGRMSFQFRLVLARSFQSHLLTIAGFFAVLQSELDSVNATLRRSDGIT